MSDDVTARLAAIERKLDMLLSILWAQQGFAPVMGNPVMPVTTAPAAPPSGGGAAVPRFEGDDLATYEALHRLTMKMHATLQMILRGASNAEIADRFGVSENTAKVYVRSIAKKLGVRLRTQVAVRCLPVLRQMDDDDYRRISHGLPKDWDATYRYAKRSDDPFYAAYTGFRVGGGDVSEDEANEDMETTE